MLPLPRRTHSIFALYQFPTDPKDSEKWLGYKQSECIYVVSVCMCFAGNRTQGLVHARYVLFHRATSSTFFIFILRSFLTKLLKQVAGMIGPCPTRPSKFLIFKKNLFFLRTCMFCLCLCVCMLCAWLVLLEVRRWCWISETGMEDRCNLTCRCLELNWGPLQVQSVLLTANQSLQARLGNFF